MAPITNNSSSTSRPLLLSFYTPGGYYEECATAFMQRAAELDLDAHVERVEVPPGKQWPDICRMKIPFLAQMRRENPNRLMFWVDVDCELRSLPDFIAGSTADIIGFQRGFGSPLRIGYANKTRFWEPCFLGFGASERASRFIDKAAELERTLKIEATDDYFIEEAWRHEAHSLTFQLVPSELGRQGPDQFFVFGSSSNVEKFRGKVTQHVSPLGSASVHQPTARERIKNALPPPALATIRQARRGAAFLRARARFLWGPLGARDAAILAKRAAIRGDAEAIEALKKRLPAAPADAKETLAAIEWSRAFFDHRVADNNKPPIPLVWWDNPYPGNFGDWLSPYIMGEISGRSIQYVQPATHTQQRHIVGLGSIAKFAQQSSVVLGSGIARKTDDVPATARYRLVRGPYTAQAVRAKGGSVEDAFGDPGILMRRLLPMAHKPAGRTALVRHFAHRALPLTLPDGMDEISIFAARPSEIKRFVQALADRDFVVTSAMHCFIVCQSYGIPCALVSFEGAEGAVVGDGVKYRDYLAGVGLAEQQPHMIPLDLRQLSLDYLVRAETVGDAALDTVLDRIRQGIADLDDSR